MTAQHTQRYGPSAVLPTARIYLACPQLCADVLQGGNDGGHYGGGDGGRGNGEKLLPSLAACNGGQHLPSLRMPQGTLASASALPFYAAAFVAKPV